MASCSDGCWDSVDIEADFQADSSVLEPFRPLWQSTFDACYENLLPTSSVTEQGEKARNRWTKEEEAQLVQCMQQYGNKWSKIATLIGTKNAIQVKTHAHYLLRRKKQGLRPNQPNSAAIKSIVKPPRPKEENVIILKDAAGIESLKNKFPTSEIVNIEKQDDDQDVNVDSSDEPESENLMEDSIGQHSMKDSPKCADSVDSGRQAQISSEVPLDVPVCEVELNAHCVSEEEKIVHEEFFSGRCAKTPERYLKIRNHIIEAWQKQKPKYVNKTLARQGLRNCGDVNCIGRIHNYLEQIGAINFGCPQVTYQKEKPERVPAKKPEHVETSRPHRRKTAAEDISKMDLKGGGVTMEHSLTGDVISRTLVHSKSKVTKLHSDPFNLVPCQKFDQEPFSIHVSTTVMLLMDVHAHLVETEVMGLLGGCYDAERRILIVLAAQPCDSLSTDLECEMDPVSQAAAMESLLVRGYDVVGWYHSHPTFVPNPSMRDLATQADYQAMFSRQGQPFVAAILSPYLPPSCARSLASEARWWISQLLSDEDAKQRETRHRLDSVPYSFGVTLIRMEQPQLVELKAKIQSLKGHIDSNPGKVELTMLYPWQPTVTYLHKMLTSLQLHITKSETETDVAGEILCAIHSVFGGQP